MQQLPKKIIPLTILSIVAFSTHAESVLEDWTWNVGASITKDNNGTTINTYYYDNIPSNIKNFQLFIDSIPNKGFNGSDGWEVFGADYLIENTSLYSSLSDTQWKWKYLGEVSLNDNQEAGDKRAIVIHNNTLLADAIEGDSVDLYIEPYDKDWVGEYFTIPLLDVSVTTDNSDSSNIDEAYMKEYVKEQYRHAGTVGLSEYSTYHKIAAVSVSYHSPSYIDVYNFQDSDTPSKIRIDMNENYLVDIKSINIVGQLGRDDQGIVFRMSSRGENPIVSIVNYNLKEKKVENITVLSRGAKEILKERLGESFLAFAITPNGQNAIVATRPRPNATIYSLYDVRDTLNPTLTHHLDTRSNGRLFRFISDTVAEYAILYTGRRIDIRYDFIQNEQISATWYRGTETFLGWGDPFQVESIALLSGGAKDILKERLGGSFRTFQLTPNTQNAIVSTRDELGRMTYSLYDIRDNLNPTLTHHLVTEESRGDIRWFRIINDTIAEYAMLIAGRVVDFRYDYIQNQEASAFQ